MKHRYRISTEGAGLEPSDTELSRYRDHGKLQYNYQRARNLLHRRPLYKDPKAFIVLLIIVLLAWLISEDSLRSKGNEKPVPVVLPPGP